MRIRGAQLLALTAASGLHTYETAILLINRWSYSSSMLLKILAYAVCLSTAWKTSASIGAAIPIIGKHQVIQEEWKVDCLRCESYPWWLWSMRDLPQNIRATTQGQPHRGWVPPPLGRTQHCNVLRATYLKTSEKRQRLSTPGLGTPHTRSNSTL